MIRLFASLALLALVVPGAPPAAAATYGGLPCQMLLQSDPSETVVAGSMWSGSWVADGGVGIHCWIQTAANYGSGVRLAEATGEGTGIASVASAVTFPADPYVNLYLCTEVTVTDAGGTTVYLADADENPGNGSQCRLGAETETPGGGTTISVIIVVGLYCIEYPWIDGNRYTECRIPCGTDCPLPRI